MQYKSEMMIIMLYVNFRLCWKIKYLIGKKVGIKWLKFCLVTKIYADYFITDQNFQILCFLLFIFGEWLKFMPVFYDCRLFYRLTFLPTIIYADFCLPIWYIASHLQIKNPYQVFQTKDQNSFLRSIKHRSESRVGDSGSFPEIS